MNMETVNSSSSSTSIPFVSMGAFMGMKPTNGVPTRGAPFQMLRSTFGMPCPRGKGSSELKFFVTSKPLPVRRRPTDLLSVGILTRATVVTRWVGQAATQERSSVFGLPSSSRTGEPL